jgi:8-oxo-dGTP diphosphatase
MTVDAAILTEKENDMWVLLIQRKREPFKDYWALPGGFVDENETLEEAIVREVREETGIILSLNEIQQFKAYSDPHRDPRQRTITMVFVAFVASDIFFEAGDDAKKAQWFALSKLPLLAFDHGLILQDITSNLTKLIPSKDQ